MPESGGLARGAALSAPSRIALMYAAMFFITGVSTPFLPIWLSERGISASDIGLLAILPQLLRSTCAPAVGLAADQHNTHRSLTIALSALGLMAWLLLSQVSGFWLALVALVLIALSNTQSPLVESIAMAGVRSQGHDYGRMRLWGSAAYVAATLTAGWLASRFGNASVIWLMLAGAAAALAVSLLLPQPNSTDENLARLPVSTIAAPPQQLTWASAHALLRLPVMAPLLLASGALQGAHGMYYTYGTLHWQSLGLDRRWFGVLWAIGLVTEIALFWWSKRAVQALSGPGLILCGAVLSVLRWGAMAFDPPLALLVPLQMLHGLTFGCSHLGAMHVLAKISPSDRMATSQALYSLVSTLGIVLATAVSAELYPMTGGHAYLAMAIMAAGGLWAAATVQRGLPQSVGEVR